MAAAKVTSKTSAKALEPENPSEVQAQPTPADSAPHPPNVTQSNRAAAASNPSTHPNPPAIDVPKAKPVGAKGSQGSSGDELVSPTGSSSSGLDIEKKVRRAERFGVPVQLSEEEKQSSRAERFGTTSGDSDASEENKRRKARAERFGLPMQSADEEKMKKKARLARFAATTKVDSLEQQKRKAREIRFSQPQSKTAAGVNGEGSQGQNAAVAGKAFLTSN